MAVGDFNSDTRPDIAIAQFTGGPQGATVFVLLNEGNGSFGNGTHFRVAITPASVVVSDFNGDEKPDLATANECVDNVSVLSGDGKGGFSPAVDFSTGIQSGGPCAIKAGDFNDDNKPDLVVLNRRRSGSISLLLNDGRGGFGAIVISGPFTAHSVEVGDFNGDGKSDLAIAGRADGVLSILLNKGSGSFSNPVYYFLGEHPYYVALGDFNGDGKTDLALPNDKAVALLLGRGDGSFGAPAKFSVTDGAYVMAITTADFDTDGKPDLAVSSANHASILLNVPCIPPNTAPVTATNASQTATVGLPFSYTANTFTDAETPTSLTYSASISPANGLSFDPATRIISGTPSLSGVSTVTISAMDSGSLSASTSFTITVKPPIILGVEELGFDATITPNPTTDVFRVSLTDTCRGVAFIALVDAVGKVLQTSSFLRTGTAGQQTLSLRGLPPGVYYLMVQQGEQRLVKKVLKY